MRPPFDILKIKPLPPEFFERRRRGEIMGDDPLDHLDEPDPANPTQTLRESITESFGGTDIFTLSEDERRVFLGAWRKRPRD